MNNFYEKGEAIVNAHNQNRKAAPYYAQYNLFTGGPNATILLAQISYWWNKNERKPFYKFKMPCGHKAYKEDDSWTEELLFTEYQFDGALKKIGTKVKTGMSIEEALKNSIVIYWTDRSRMTWYQLNEKLFYTLVGLAYIEPSRLANLEKSGYSNLGKPNYNNPEKPGYISTSEITTEITTTPEVDDFEERFGPPKSNAMDTPPTATDMLTEEGRQRMQERLLESRAIRMGNQPWLKFNSGRYTMREGIEPETLQRIDWYLFKGAGLQCTSTNKKTLSNWINGLVEMYQAAEGNIRLIQLGIEECRTREPRYRPSNPFGYSKVIRKLAADRRPGMDRTYDNNDNQGRSQAFTVVHVQPKEESNGDSDKA